MKSVGEVMAIGRTFKEALWKGMRSLETGKAFGSEKFDKALVTPRLITPTPDRLNYIRYAMANGYGVQDIHELTSIDPWFLEQIKEVVDFERDLANAPQEKEVFRRAKRYGISDVQLCSAGWTPVRRSSKASRRTSTPVTKAPARLPRARGRRS
jgi:carbamoyl-phosphate synthase large subunit